MATNTDNLLKNEVGRAFIERYASDVIGVLHGWDRLRLQGTLRSLYYPPVMEQYLRKAGVMWKDFKQFAIGLTSRVRQASEDVAKEQQRPVIYLTSSRVSKEDEARQIQQRDGVKKGLIAILSLCGAVPEVEHAWEPSDQETGAEFGVGEVHASLFLLDP